MCGLRGNSVGVKLPDHKTKIVCTIGPVSRSEIVLEELMRRGMNVARHRTVPKGRHRAVVRTDDFGIGLSRQRLNHTRRR